MYVVSPLALACLRFDATFYLEWSREQDSNLWIKVLLDLRLTPWLSRLEIKTVLPVLSHLQVRRRSLHESFCSQDHEDD
jgi:hypothetical protein